MQAGQASQSKEDVIKKEGPLLFDFIVRMTADSDQASSLLLEVSAAITGERDDADEDIRLLLFKTARNFANHKWLELPDELLDIVYQDVNGAELLKAVEKSLSAMPANQREVMLLRFRYGFNVEQIVSLTNIKAKNVNHLLLEGELKLSKEIEGYSSQTMAQLSLFSPSNSDVVSTAALSEIIELDRGGQFRKLRSVFWLALLVTVIFYYVSNG